MARDDDGRFVLGPRVGALAQALPDALVAAAAPVLAWVRDECGESAQLYRRDGSARVCVAAAERATGLRTTVPVGSRLPLTAGSGAQVLCAWSSPPATARGRRSSARGRWPKCAGAAGRSQSGNARPGSRRCRRRCCRRTARCSGAISISGPIERLGRAPGARYGPVLVTGATRISAALS